MAVKVEYFRGADEPRNAAEVESILKPEEVRG
jgi:hypothetical protein